MRGDHRALSPLARARGRDHQHSHHSSPPVIIPPAGPRPIARRRRRRAERPDGARLAKARARKRARRTPSYERQKPRTLVFMPHAISAVRAHVEVAVRNGLAAVVIPRPRLSLAAVAARRSWYEGGYG